MMNQNPKVQKKHNLKWLVDLAQDASVGKVVNVLGTFAVGFYTYTWNHQQPFVLYRHVATCVEAENIWK